MGPDNEYITCTQLSEDRWKRIADTGGKISLAPAIEMHMRHGMPPLQTALDHGIRPSLSVDVEYNTTADRSADWNACARQRSRHHHAGHGADQHLPVEQCAGHGSNSDGFEQRGECVHRRESDE